MTTTGFFLSSSSPNHVIRGILTILTGLFMLFMPGITMQTVMIMIGVMFLISGLITLILSNIRRNRGMKGFWSFQGIANLAFGFAFVVAPNAMLHIFVFFVGCILLLLGIIQLINSLGTFSISRWSWIFLILSLLTLGGGILLLFNPFESVKAILSLVGFLFVIYGISEISLASKAKYKSNYHKEGNIKDIPYEEL
jgi:uncharacterized membrane protein HdeD (DUF308 family)